MRQLISVIMPACNAGKYIAESIRSVLDQTYQNWEQVVVHDGSTDNTADIVRSFQRGGATRGYVRFREEGQN